MSEKQSLKEQFIELWQKAWADELEMSRLTGVEGGKTLRQLLGAEFERLKGQELPSNAAEQLYCYYIGDRFISDPKLRTKINRLEKEFKAIMDKAVEKPKKEKVPKGE